jgi:hypothetical protein
MKCCSCGLVIIAEFDEIEQEYNKPWEDQEGNRYCDQCYYEMFTSIEEKALENYNHDNKLVRERSRKKLKKLEEFWGNY